MAYTSGRLFAGTTAVTTVAAPISTSSSNMREAIIQSDPTNTTNVLVGNATSQTVILTPGQAITIPVISLSLVYVKMASLTGTVNWLARD